MVQNRPWPEVSLKQSGGMRPMGAQLHEGPCPLPLCMRPMDLLGQNTPETALWGWRTQVRGKSHINCESLQTPSMWSPVGARREGLGPLETRLYGQKGAGLCQDRQP